MSAQRQADLASEIADLKERLAAALDQLGRVSAMYGSEIERLRALLNDRNYIRNKADYNRGYLSHAGWLEEKERGLGLIDWRADEQSQKETP